MRASIIFLAMILILTVPAAAGARDHQDRDERGRQDREDRDGHEPAKRAHEGKEQKDNADKAAAPPAGVPASQPDVRPPTIVPDATGTPPQPVVQADVRLHAGLPSVQAGSPLPPQPWANEPNPRPDAAAPPAPVPPLPDDPSKSLASERAAEPDAGVSMASDAPTRPGNHFGNTLAFVTGLGSLPGFGLVAGLVIGISGGVLTTHAHLRRPRAPTPTGVRATPATPTAAPAAGSFTTLVRRVESNPFDGEARVSLGIELLRRGDDAVALRHLAQGFRYHPAGIIAVLQDPALAFVRDHDEVRRILKRFHRDQTRRVWAGYA